MDDLRWALLILGALFLGGLGIWELRRSRGRGAGDAPPQPPLEKPARREPPRLSEATGVRREPRIGDFGADVEPPVVLPVMEAAPSREAPPVVELSDVDELPPPALAAMPDETPEEEAPAEDAPAPAAPEPLRVGIAVEEAVDIPGATTVVAEDPRPIRWPPEELPERVLGLRVIAEAAPFLGKSVRQALMGAGLRHGPQQIFHRTDSDGNVLASVANLVRPGSLLPGQMDGQEFRGLSLFAVIPGPRPAPQMLEGLVDLARQIANRLGGSVQDEHGQVLDSERLTQLRRTVASLAEPDGDGAVP